MDAGISGTATSKQERHLVRGVFFSALLSTTLALLLPLTVGVGVGQGDQPPACSPPQLQALLTGPMHAPPGAEPRVPHRTHKSELAMGKGPGTLASAFSYASQSPR